MGIKENKITNKILEALPMIMRLFRNHVGVVQDKKGAWHKFGLPKGSADLIGFTILKVTPGMVGKDVPVFTSVEVKTPTGRLSKEQKLWSDFMERVNALHVVARSPEEVKQASKEYKQKMEETNE
tara:strand:- start:1427 stop:1801 length:375 start_codon:yes stop_codon:yes gene_type:complete